MNYDRSEPTRFTVPRQKQRKRHPDAGRFKKVIICIPGVVVSVSAVSYYLYWIN